MANQSKTFKGKFTYKVGRVDPWLRDKSSMKAWRKDGPDAIVFHWTGGSTLSSAINTLVKNKLGYHFFINPDGNIVQGMPINQRAPHAGFSWGPRGDTYAVNQTTVHTSCNDYAIGISFVYNPTGNTDVFTDKQITSAKELVAFLQSKFLSIKYVTTHFEITPSRKGDIYFWGKVTGGSSIGHKFVTSINAQHNLKLKFWECGNDWEDKNNTFRTFKYATENGIGGFDENGFRVDGSYGRISYTKEKRNQNIAQYQKDYKQAGTTFSGNDVLGQ